VNNAQKRISLTQNSDVGMFSQFLCMVLIFLQGVKWRLHMVMMSWP